jgi:hypothetical protein
MTPFFLLASASITDGLMTASMTIIAVILLAMMSAGRVQVAAFTHSPCWRRAAGVSSLLSTLSMATWSDSRAVREYQDFLASGQQEISMTPDRPSVIVRPAEGSSELAEGLFAMGFGNDVVITPEQELPYSEELYPIYITIPPTQLKQFLTTLRDSFRERRDDFVFFSGGLTFGNIEKVLKDYGYCRDTMTQVLITGMKFSPRIDDISVNLGNDAQGEVKLAGECCACGKWQGSISQRLERNGVRCKTGFYREWRRSMVSNPGNILFCFRGNGFVYSMVLLVSESLNAQWERSAYDAVFHVVGAVRAEPTSLKDVAIYYDAEASDMLWSISGMLRGSRAITITYGFEERLFGIAEASDPQEQCRLVDSQEMWPFLYEPFEDIPKFMEYMCYAQDECGLLPSVSFLRRNINAMEKPPVIRPGNLRADGVV